LFAEGLPDNRVYFILWGLKIPVRPISGIPNPQPGFIQVPRTRSPSHPWLGQPVCQTVPNADINATSRIFTENKSLNKVPAIEALKGVFEFDLASMRKMTVIMSLVV
jgi:hypothetical protein